MPFIGKNPTAGFSTIVKDTLTADGTTTQFTLSKQVGNATDIAVFVGNVRQEPTTAYTVNGTTLDFGSGNAPATGLDMYVLHIGGTQETSIVPADGTISSAKLTTNIAVSGNLDIGGVSTEPNKEYFRAQLNSSQTPIADAAEATVDFNGNGNVNYDTKSKWDSANNAYEFDSNGGVYLISFAALICSDAVNTEVLQDVGVQVEVATDGSTYSGLFGSYQRPNDSASENVGSVATSGTYIYKTTTATTKIRLRVKADTLSGANYEVRFDDGNMQSLNFTATGGKGTYLNVVRIA